MNLRNPLFLFLGFFAALLAGCTKEYPSIEEEDNLAIQDYIKKNNISAQQYGTTGIYYQVISAGTGGPLDYTAKTPAIFTAKAITNSFSAQDTFAAFNRFSDYFGYLRIKGTAVSETLPKLVSAAQVKAGGSIRLLIPSRLLFGRNPTTNVPGYGTEIPGNTCMDFVIRFYSTASLAAYDDSSIKKYMLANNLSGFTKLATGTYYKITDAGSTTVITTSSTISTEYTGKLLNGTVFDSSSGSTYTFLLSDLVPGWQDAVPLIKKGGTIEMIIPSARAYGLNETLGSTGAITIPAFSTLYFKVKVTDVE